MRGNLGRDGIAFGLRAGRQGDVREDVPPLGALVSDHSADPACTNYQYFTHISS